MIIGGSALGVTVGHPAFAASTKKLTLKSGSALPLIGMGTWLTFNVGAEEPAFDQRAKVLDRFLEMGGGMIDSSPMYGRAEAAIGQMMASRNADNLFSATKIWAAFDKGGPMQLSDSHRLWAEPVLDLVHVHNLLNWESHLKTLRTAKDAGTVRYIGLTTSHGRRHAALEKLIRSEPIDAVQFTYNINDREAENRLLPAAADQGLTVIINRPFQGGRLFDRIADIPLPEWAAEWDIQSWAAFFLKFVISHPAVSCAIPATSRVSHMEENMRALTGPLPDAAARARMAAHFRSLI